MSTLDEVADVAAGRGLALRRSWPRSADHLLLELVPPAGPAVAGQWFADPARAAHVADRTGPPAAAHGRVVLQPAGADRRLPAVAALLRRPGGRLVAHRPERRAVVRTAEGTYVKAVRPDRLGAVARAARSATGCGVRVPEVLRVDVGAGTITTAALPGRTLHELLAERSPLVPGAAHAAGRALAALHAAPIPAGAPVHDGAAELAVLEQWRALAREHGLPAAAPGDDDADQEPGVDPLLAPGGPLVRVHRDLHDKQLLVDGDAQVGLLDFDLAAAGEAALDLSNLLVHLELRAAQGVCPPELAREAADAVLDGYAPSSAVLDRLPAYDRAARRRLVAVYAFRGARGAAAASRLAAAAVPVR